MVFGALIAHDQWRGAGSMSTRFHLARPTILADGIADRHVGDDGPRKQVNVLRDHRKLLVCDSKVAFVGGFNIADEYDGDGVSSGWRDFGLKLEGALVVEGLGDGDARGVLTSVIRGRLDEQVRDRILAEYEARPGTRHR
jgi:hypothetical protein